MNNVILSGRLTKKPESRMTQSGLNVCSFSLAVNRFGSTNCDFIECVCFGKTAENLVKFQDKGNMIELIGRIENNQYTDKDGKNRSKTVVSVSMINYIKSSQTSRKSLKNDEKDAYLEMNKRIEEDNLPF